MQVFFLHTDFMQLLWNTDAQRKLANSFYRSFYTFCFAHAGSIYSHRLGNIQIFRCGRRFCIVFHDIRQQQCIGYAVRSVIVCTERMSHRVNDSQAYVAESHSGNILCLRHGFTSYRITAIVYSSLQVLGNHLNGLQFKHIRHHPGSRSNVAFNGMCQGIHTCSRSQALRHRIHQFRVYDSYRRNIVRVYTHHFLGSSLINNHIVDGYLSRSSRSSRQSKSRHCFMMRICYPFQ